MTPLSLPPSARESSVLVVEDYADLRRMMVRMLSKAGIEKIDGVGQKQLLEALEGLYVSGLEAEKQNVAAAPEVAARLEGAGHRVEVREASADSLGARIRRSKLLKVPYVLVVGDDDVAGTTVGVNARGADDPERGVRLEVFATRLGDEVEARA